MTENSFAERFEAYLRAQQDYCAYLAAQGIYRTEGSRAYWEPTDPTDLEPQELHNAPGAMRRGELDDWDSSEVEEF